MRVIHSFAARSCFDKLSTNGEFLPSVVFAVRPDVMDDSGSRKRRNVLQLLELLPRGSARMAATNQPIAPRLLRMLENALQHAIVTPQRKEEMGVTSCNIAS